MSHPRVRKSLGFYLIKIVSAWYNKHSADEKDYGVVQNVPGPKAAEAERPWSQTWHDPCVVLCGRCWLVGTFFNTWHPSIFGHLDLWQRKPMFSLVWITEVKINRLQLQLCSKTNLSRVKRSFLLEHTCRKYKAST